MPLPRRLLAEFLGTALLIACVVGSGIMGVQLSDGNEGSTTATSFPIDDVSLK
jgi:glycerol uptake facilitator-like aquaporin